MKMEQWKVIEGYEDYYEISNHGNVRSLDRTVEYVNGRVCKYKSRIKSTTLKKTGYVHIVLSKDNIDKSFSIHRLVAKTFILNPENKETVNHKDGIKTNNHVNNLEWNSMTENNQHAIDIGLVNNKGENNGRSKLTQKEVDEIRAKYIPYKYTAVKLAKEYGVYKSTIKKIINKTTWH